MRGVYEMRRIKCLWMSCLLAFSLMSCNIIDEVSEGEIEYTESSVETYVSSLDGKIICIFMKQDITDNDISILELNEFVEKLADIRSKLQYVSADYKPYDDITRIDFTENLSFTGLAGNPILIDREEFPVLWKKYKDSDINNMDSDSILYLLAHEMSHTFDYENDSPKSYVFDIEYFASLKAYVALETCGYTVDDNLFTVNPGLDEGVYNYQDFVYRTIEFLGNNRTAILRRVFLELQMLEEQTIQEYFYTYTQMLNDCTERNLKEYLEEKGWNTLEKHFAG